MDAANLQHSFKSEPTISYKDMRLSLRTGQFEEPRPSKSADIQDNKASINGVFNVEGC